MNDASDAVKDRFAKFNKAMAERKSNKDAARAEQKIASVAKEVERRRLYDERTGEKYEDFLRRIANYVPKYNTVRDYRYPPPGVEPGSNSVFLAPLFFVSLSFNFFSIFISF